MYLRACVLMRAFGAVVEENGGMYMAIRHRVSAAWGNWKKCSGMLCERKMSVKLTWKIYRTVVSAPLLYGTETWSTTKSKENGLGESDMRLLRWICGVTKKDKIRNEHVRGSVQVAPLTHTITEKRLKW